MEAAGELVAALTGGIVAGSVSPGDVLKRAAAGQLNPFAARPESEAMTKYKAMIAGRRLAAVAGDSGVT